MKPTLDLPPVWLLGALALVWALHRLAPGLALGWWWLSPLGWLLIAAGVLAMGLAVVALVRHRTTLIPRQTPSALVTAGIFRLSRNPIYLGDALVLTGAVLVWDVWPALALVPAFVLLITRRFILAEEAALRAGFGAEADAWFDRVRRWL